jgi:uncharacterized protein
MKMSEDKAATSTLISRYGDGFIEVEQEEHRCAIILMPERPVRPWPVPGHEELVLENFLLLLEYGPEVILLGTGENLHFPSPEIGRYFLTRNIGFEVMPSTAACRTYNILASEGRQVLAALLPP